MYINTECHNAAIAGVGRGLYSELQALGWQRMSGWYKLCGESGISLFRNLLPAVASVLSSAAFCPSDLSPDGLFFMGAYP
ncbi:TPA: hypothetical protein JLV43_002444 [Escherichia coli]|nr:hypothetical protein [Escherichia coli]